jgi:hypothetical protein
VRERERRETVEREREIKRVWMDKKRVGGE